MRHDHHERGHAPPSTEGESGGVRGDARICSDICKKGDTSKNSVQRCVSDRGPARQGGIHFPLNEATGKPATKSNHAGRNLNRSDSASRKKNRSDNNTNVSKSSGSAMKPAPKKHCAGRASSSKFHGKKKMLARKTSNPRATGGGKRLDGKRI